MSEVKGHESENGDMQYYAKIMTCPCCKKTMPAKNFASRINNYDDMGSLSICKTICNKCRKPITMPSTSVKWNNTEIVREPAMIKLMEYYRDR